MAWCQEGDKPLSETMMVRLLMHLCITQSQWVNWTFRNIFQRNLNKNTAILIKKNEFKNVVCKMSAILFYLLRVNPGWEAHLGRVIQEISCKLPLSTGQWGKILTPWSRDKMAAISQTTHLNAFSWKKMFEFPLKFHRSLFLSVQLTIFQHWFR